MGHNLEVLGFQTFVADPFDPDSALRTNRDDDRRPITEGTRTGLWRLNGFDRAFDASVLGVPLWWDTQLVWLRSVPSIAIGNANTVYHTGNRYEYGVNQLAGVRPAIHMSLTALRELLEQYN